MNRLTRAAIAGAALSLSTGALADWSIDNSRSQVNLVSTKKVSIAENFHFDTVSGSLSDSGKLEVVIDLNSISTGVDIRNQRIKQNLFQTGLFASATFSAALTPKTLNTLKQGGLVQTQVVGMLDFHGVKSQLTIAVDVMANGDTLLASTRKPVLINGGQFGLEGGFANLSQVMGGIDISRSVPVSFNLVLSR